MRVAVTLALSLLVGSVHAQSFSVINRDVCLKQKLFIDLTALQGAGASQAPVVMTALSKTGSHIAWAKKDGRFGLVTSGGVLCFSAVRTGAPTTWVGTPSERWALVERDQVKGLCLDSTTSCFWVVFGDGHVEKFDYKGVKLGAADLPHTAASVAFDRLRACFLVGSDQGVVSEFDLASFAKKKCFGDLLGAGAVVSALEYSPAIQQDCFLVGAGSFDPSAMPCGLAVFDRSSGGLKAKYVVPGGSVFASFDGTSSRIVSGSGDDGTATIHSSGNPVTGLRGGGQLVRLQDVGTGQAAFLVCRGSRQVLCFRASDGAELLEVALPRDITNGAVSVAADAPCIVFGYSEEAGYDPQAYPSAVTIAKNSGLLLCSYQIVSGSILVGPLTPPTRVATFAATGQSPSAAQVDAVGAMVGHRAPVHEIQMSPVSGGICVSRDAKGIVLGWLHPGTPGASGVVVPVTALPDQGASAMSFNSSGSHGLIIAQDWTIRRIATATPTATPQVISPNLPVGTKVVSALETGSGKYLIAGHNGGLYLHTAGGVTSTLVQAGAQHGTPFHRMRRSWSGAEVALVPREQHPDHFASSNVLQLRSITTVATITGSTPPESTIQTLHGTRLSYLGADRMLVGSEWSLQQAALYDVSVSTVGRPKFIDARPDLNCASGLVDLWGKMPSDRVSLACSRAQLSLVEIAVDSTSGTESLILRHTENKLSSSITASASASSEKVLALGFDSGIILRCVAIYP